MKELEFYSDQTIQFFTQGVHFKNIWNLTLTVPILAQFNPIQPKQLLDMYEGVRIQFRPENKCWLNQWVHLKNILKLSPHSSWGLFSPI